MPGFRLKIRPQCCRAASNRMKEFVCLGLAFVIVMPGFRAQMTTTVFQCPESGLPGNFLHPHPTDCSKFFICDHSKPHEMQCPQGLYYQPHNKVCDFPTNVNCTVTPEPPTNPCAPTNPCQHGGSCSVTASGGYLCTCINGYHGAKCEVSPELPTNPCVPTNPCQHGGSCSVTASGGYMCTCINGYRGANCEVPPESPTTPCAPANPCQHGGSCSVTAMGDYLCTCINGYRGANCEAHVCANNPCQPGTCLADPGFSSSGGFLCQCPGSDILTQTSCPPSGGGKCSVKPCQNGGLCAVTDTALGYACGCTPGFTGTRCESVLCSAENDPCENGGTCRADFLQSPGYHCVCPPGYTGTHCRTASSVCEPSPCQNGLCQPSGDGFTCVCSLGYVGTLCDHFDVCTQLTSICGLGTCVPVDNVTRPFRCDCTDTGFVGDYCENMITPCGSSNPCQHGGTCSVTTTGSYMCSCVSGYQGTSCEFVDACASSPCANGGSCQNDGHGFTCACLPDYYGATCDSSTSGPCAGQPFPCPADVAYFTYPDYDNAQCNTYFECRSGLLVRRQCSPGLKYNSATLRCEREDGDPLRFFCDRVKQAFQTLKDSNALGMLG